jgi:hypothetical protein
MAEGHNGVKLTSWLPGIGEAERELGEGARDNI